MVTIRPKTDKPMPHDLVARKKILTMDAGEMKTCYIQQMTDKRFEVFACASRDYFHHVFETKEELNETFNEQTRL